jgi:hypothetical protein
MGFLYGDTIAIFVANDGGGAAVDRARLGLKRGDNSADTVLRG